MNVLRPILASVLIIVNSLAATVQAADNTALRTVIETRSAEDRVRDRFRHPSQTLTFFQVAPGMTVAEGLPGGGWYTRIIAPYLGAQGAIYGINYPDRMWSLFSWTTPEIIDQRIAATAAFPDMVAAITDNGVSARGFTFEAVPEDVNGTVDRVLLIRALHNLNRFEVNAQTASRALASIHTMLADDGMVGVVQHRAPESADDAWADGSRGYLKQSAVIAMFDKAGFELVAESDVNANPKDRPGADDSVWRLPPSLRGSKDDPQTLAAMRSIGESDRMTLLFRKRRSGA